ncbi:MAG: RNB domain-containing ribonuclease, partial [Candidatus Marinimicrobia bacterium]|nr:RNB domain-containing ribonuclease [Candidatus Neomarinimicrobiota bacterium]
HYVRPGSFTDAEAQLRGNSVYFTEAVVPMLPHLLSSDICSLRPDEDRPVLSAMITLTSTGDVEEVRFHRAMIRSRHRFTYEEVQDILQSRSGQWYQLLDDLRRITSGLYAKRVAAGSVDFDIPEPLLELDEYGVPHHIRPSQRLDSHRMVEECMLLANRLVAERVPQAKPRKPFLYRVHAQPPQDQIRKLTSLLGKLRLPELPAGKVTSGHVRDLLQALADSPYRDLIETITIRSMAKALYSADEQPHFGLAFPLYTHFTSPIRRYSDLIVHRLVSAYLLDGKMPRPGLKALASVASSCSEREQTALRAERAYQRLKELRFLATQVGKSFDGVVSGVLPSGIFVQIREFLVDGFVGQQWLNDDIYQYDEGHYALRGKHTGRVLQLGQEVHIQVRDVSVERRFADFILVDGES